MNSVEILEKKEQLKVDARNIIHTAHCEIRMLTDDENERINSIKNELESLNEELRKLQVELPVEEDNKNINKRKQMEQKFSLIKAIRNVANNKSQDAVSQAVIDAGQEEMRKAGMNYVGQIQLPSAEFRTVTVTTEHDDVVATDMMDVIEPLRAKNVLVQAGAKFISGLVGDVQYPVMSAVNATWEGETATTPDSTPTFTNVKLSPKRMSVVVPISKQFIIQDGVGAEQAIRNEIINAINSKLEATILGSAAGTTTQPEGIFYNGGSALTQLTDFTDICNLEAGVESANVYGEMSYIMSPTAKAALRGMAKTGTNNGLVYENGEIDGTKAFATSNVPATDIVYGDFSNMVIASWGNIDLTVDTVTLAADGCIRLVINAYFDAKKLRNAAFAVAKM